MLLGVFLHGVGVLLDRVPLVDQHHRAFPGIQDKAGDMRILRGDPAGRIDHQESTTSARSMARSERSTLYFSTPGSILPRRRMPAVSIRVTGTLAEDQVVSMASRVVPGIGLTMARSSPSSRLSRLDLPTFGLPTMAILTESLLLPLPPAG